VQYSAYGVVEEVGRGVVGEGAVVFLAGTYWCYWRPLCGTVNEYFVTD